MVKVHISTRPSPHKPLKNSIKLKDANGKSIKIIIINWVNSPLVKLIVRLFAKPKFDLIRLLKICRDGPRK